MAKNEIIFYLNETIDDHETQMQYADKDETEWREDCIKALKAAVKLIEKC